MHLKRKASQAFTLIELLVVIAIIAILVSILMPTLSKAKEMAKRASCSSNQRNLVTGCHMYAGDYNGFYPISSIPLNDTVLDASDVRDASAHDLRGGVSPDDPKPRVPAGLGLLISGGLASPNAMFYCPSLDNRSGMNAGRGMDMIYLDDGSVGTSLWNDAFYTDWRVTSGYLYRWPSYARTHAKDGLLAAATDSNLNGSNILLVDHLDIDFGFKLFGHREGFVRFFADGHGGYWKEPGNMIEEWFKAKAPPRGGWHTYYGIWGAPFEEELYTILETK